MDPASARAAEPGSTKREWRISEVNFWLYSSTGIYMKPGAGKMRDRIDENASSFYLQVVARGAW